MVLQLRQQDAVARLQQRAIGISHQVDRRLDSRILVGFGRALGQTMHAAQHVGAFRGLVDAHRVEHDVGRLRGGAVVEVVHRLAADDLRQDGKLPANGGNVEAHGGLPARQLARASGVSISVKAASPVISTSHTRSACSPIRCLAPESPESLAISPKKRWAHSTGLPRLPRTVGTQIERPSTGLKAAISRSSRGAFTPGMSPSWTIAASMVEPSAATPVRTDVLRPSAKSGLLTKRRRALSGTACSTTPLTSSAIWPSTTTTSTACEASAAVTA